jgi:uncharacterized RDD family membrane protein YckC
VPYGQVSPVGAHLAGDRRRTEVGPVLPAQHAGAPGGTPAQEQDRDREQDEDQGRDQESDPTATGLPSQVPGPLAGFGARSVSFLIDTVVPWLLLGVLIFVGAAADMLVLSLVLFAFGYLGVFAFTTWNSCYRQGTTGQSIGRRVAGTRLVKIETGEPVGFAVALLRHVCHMVEFGIGLLWPLWDRQRQTFADKLVGTVVVRIEGSDASRGPQEPAPAEP